MKFLYHFTEYKVSPSRSKSQAKSTDDPFATLFGTSSRLILRADVIDAMKNMTRTVDTRPGHILLFLSSSFHAAKIDATDVT